MITTNLEILRLVSDNTLGDKCEELQIFPLLEQALAQSKIAGYGLAAIQIEIPKRACIVRYKDLKLNMINPIIEKTEELYRFQNEGCLSIPGVYLDTERYKRITVRWFDYDKKEESRAVFYDMEAAIISHEVDHMDGILIRDRLAKKKVKVGRNEPCPCGSRKKFKKCCEGVTK